MSEAYAREILRRNIAQICQTIGWNGINSTPLDVLVHVLEKYIRTLGTQANRYAEEFNRTEPNLHDLGLVFRDLHVQLPELAEYTRSVPPVPPPVNVDKFPKSKESNLNFLKPGSHEVVTRPMHVHEHLPAMYPEKETPTVADTIEIRQNGIDLNNTNCNSPDLMSTDSPDKQKDPFKRPIDPISLPNSKRPRLRLEEEERTREISSVMMTMSGFLSPAREGKLPEARPPTVISERHEKHKANSHHSNLLKVPTFHAPLEKSDKKSKKSKLLNGKIVKSKRKDRSHKGENSKSKDSNKLDKRPPKGKEVHPTHLNNIAATVPKPMPPPPPIVDTVRPVVKQEPVEHAPPVQRNVLPGEDSIPVPRKIPISKSPLVPNSSTIHVNKSTPIVHHSATKSLIPETEIKKEVVEEAEKLASQPDRSKVNIFKRITNKSKEDRFNPEVLSEKSQSESTISHLENIPSYNATRLEKQYPAPSVIKVKSEDTVTHASDAIDLSRQMDLTTNEVISIDDDSLDLNSIPSSSSKPVNFNSTLYSMPASKPLLHHHHHHLPYPKDILGISPKQKKDKKHKEKKDKSIDKAAKLEAKMLKRRQQQQLAFEMAAHVEKQPFGNIKFPNIKPPKLSRSKNDAKLPPLPPGFPFFPIGPGPGLIPNPGLMPSDFFAGIANNPALRGLQPSNLLANPFALSTGPGLIPGPSYLPAGLGPGIHNTVLPMGNFGHSSRSQARNIAPLLRRPSLEVIPVDNENERNAHSTTIINPLRDKERHDKHKIPTIPNILQKHKSRLHKDGHHKHTVFKMPPVQPDITIELNPPQPKPEIVKEEPVITPPPVRVPTPEPPVIEHPPPVTPLVPDDLQEKETDKVEKKKDKSHKKEKKDKDGLKIKKKKDKRDKNKIKTEKKKEKDEKEEVKTKIKKEKKEKRKEKVQVTDGLVPKLTLKLGSASPMPPSSPDIFKLNIKPIVKKDDDETSSVKLEAPSRESSRSPELAQISALVTRPPKTKHSNKHNHVSEQIEVKSPPEAVNSPPRKNRPPSSHSKYKRILFKPLTKKSHMEHYDDSDISTIAEEPPPKLGSDKLLPVPLPTPYYMDKHGNKIWVCPACGRPDNGSAMIGCDGCDGWYHWACVGISEDPGASEDWFCKSCTAKREATLTAQAGIPSSKKRGRKAKTENVRDCH